MVNEPTSIEIIGNENVSAVLSGPDQLGDTNKTGVIIAHGAANDMNNSLIIAVAERLATSGYTTLRFNFPYKEKGKKSPDTESTLIRTWQSAVSHISNNWLAQPLCSYETVLKFIRTTSTSAGLKIRAVLNRKQYQKGIRISDSEMKSLNLKHYTQRPNWNYAISPAKM